MNSKLNVEKIHDNIALIMSQLIKQQNGCVILEMKQESIYKKYVGFADFAKKIEVSAATQFLIGSVTKQFAAVAILKALNDVKVRTKTEMQVELNNPIEYYLPAEHEIWQGLMPAWAKLVTLHQLLVHSSGIPNYTSLPDFEKQNFAKSSDLITFFKNHKLEFIPGEKFSYSNSGYYLLGLIIQQIVEQNLATYLEKIFFKPLGMNSTYLPIKGTVNDLLQSDTRFTNLARGYAYEITNEHANLEEIKRYEGMETPGLAGGLISTAEDLLTWNKALYTGKIIPNHLLELMLQPYLVTEREHAFYGYGIEVMHSDIFGEYYSHRGGITGYRSILTYIPTLQISIATLQNIMGNPEKVIPEIEKIRSQLPQTLTPEESMNELVKIIEDKYPSIVKNKLRYEFSPIYDEILKSLVS